MTYNNQKPSPTRKPVTVTVKVTLDDISRNSLLKLRSGMAKEVERDIKLFRRLAAKG